MRTDRAARVAGEPPGKLECRCVCERERQRDTSAHSFTFAAAAAGFAFTFTVVSCFLGCCCWFGPPPPLDWDEAAGTEQNSSETK